MRRLCIYLVFDKENMIDQYIIYMLQELRTCSAYIMVVNNSPNIKKGKDELENYADKVICRDNIGFDAGGFKEALCNYVGWDKVFEYDELILVNDSIFGPFKPMKSIFSEMDKKEVDFWGLATHGTTPDGVLEHIQTYFLVIRSKMLHSNEFKNYWENMPFYTTFSEVVYQHEVKFTHYFKTLGYSYDVLADIRTNDSEINPQNNYMQYAMLSYELIKKRNFPFLKKQQIAYDTLLCQTQENLHQAIDYIDKKTDYDINLIWDNIIRTLNVADLQRSLHLQYIIFSEKLRSLVEKKVVIVIFADHKEAIEYILDYFNNLDNNSFFSIQIVSEDENILKDYGAYKLNMSDFSLRRRCDWEELIQYDYVCILHDVDMTSDVMQSCIGKSYFYCVWENLFKDVNHILGILEKFEEEEKLGFLAPPKPNFWRYFADIDGEWDEMYKITKTIATKLKLNCQISEKKPPFRVTNSFWIRGNILECLKNIKENEQLYLPYLWSYFAQHKGYYSGIVESVDYASMNEVNMQHYLNQIVAQVKMEYGKIRNFIEMKEKILLGALKLFCENYSRILIYGAGYYARKYLNILSNVEACIISDGQKGNDYLEGVPVIYLSEVKNLSECGVVLCLNQINQKQVIPILKQYGVNDYFCIPCLS